MQKYLLFSIGEYTMGVEIDSVMHILDMDKLMAQYNTGNVKGIVFEQNEMFVVLDLREKVNKNFKADISNKILIVEKKSKGQKNPFGFVVDKVYNISEGKVAEDLDAADEKLLNKEEVKYIVDISGSIYPIVDLNYFVSKEDNTGITSAKKDYEKEIMQEQQSGDDEQKKKAEKMFRGKKIEQIWKKKHEGSQQ